MAKNSVEIGAQAVEQTEPRSWWVLITAILVSLLVVAVLFSFPVLLPKFGELWQGFGLKVAELPSFTRVVVFAHIKFRFLVKVLMFVQVALLAVYLRKNTQANRKAFWYVSLFNGAMAIMVVVALYLPMFGIANEI